MDENIVDKDSSSDFSDADPAEILNSIKNIDDLDAELFGPKKATPIGKKKEMKSVKNPLEKKKVSFHDSVELNEGFGKSKKTISKNDAFDFDMDDPLADLLSDGDYEDEYIPEATQSRSANKKESADDWLFADDNADDLLDDGSNKTRQKVVREENKPKLSVQSLMKRSSTDELLKPSSSSVRKMTIDDFASNAAKLSPEKMASPYTASSAPNASKNIKFDDDFGFGSYQPTVTTDDNKRKGRSRRPQSSGGGFFDFLKEDSAPKIEESKWRPQSSGGSFFDFLKEEDSAPKIEETPQELSPAVSQTETISSKYKASTRPASAELSLQSPKVEVDIIKHEKRPRSSDADKSTPTRERQVIYETPFRDQNSNVVEPKTSTDTAMKSHSHTGSNYSRPRRRSSDSPFLGGPSPAFEKPYTPPFQSQLDLNVPTKPVQQSSVYHHEIKPLNLNGGESQLQILEAQLEHNRALLHNAELGYKADLEVTKTMYDSRIELLNSSFEDLRARIDRELESVRESYSARIGVLRNAMQSQVQADTSKECEHQGEIKRLRNLHLQALDECRHDGDSEIARLREGHAKEMEAVKNSTYHARNIESMMSRVEESTDRLQQLSSKYESAHRAMTQQSETIALSNKQLISVVQNQLGQQQKLTSDAQIQIQQTASRLEGHISEMNRKMEEQHYAMQLSHSSLQSAHTALQEERKQFMQQITLEREHLRKAHREMINLQNDIRQETREDRAKLMRSADDITTITTRFEESKIIETEQSIRRNRDHEEMMNQLNMEKMEVAKKRAQLESANEKLATQKQDLNNKFIQFNEEKQILHQIQQELEQREAEVNVLTQKSMDSEADKERIFAEAKRIEDDQARKLAEIHNETKELAKQRQMLAEERRALAQERNYGDNFTTPHPAAISSPIVQAVSATSSVTPIKQRLLFGHPGSPGQTTTSSGIMLWQHSAKKDQSFLEDEQFFLETLKNSPYSKK